MHDDLGNRMKDNYENRFRYQLTRRIPVIIRVDGKAFHTLTQGCEPFDKRLTDTMTATALHLCEEIQGVKCAYKQSDEISLLLTDYDLITTQAWFDYNLQKVVSISASMAAVKFTELWGKHALFDSRAFNIPVDEVANYFIWRQKDWLRNSVAMLAQSHFSSNQLHGKSQADMHEMLRGVGVNWDDLEPRFKNGTFIHKVLWDCDKDDNPIYEWRVKENTIFTQDRDIIEQYLGRKD